MALVIRFKLRSKRKNTPKALSHYVSIRLRVNGLAAKSDIATGVAVGFAEWDSKKQLIKGRADLTAAKNQQLRQMATDLTEIFNALNAQNKPVSAEIIKQMYTGKSQAITTGVLQLYGVFLAQHHKNVSADTLQSWKSRQAALTQYVQHKLKRKDVQLSEITPRWANEYYEWYKSRPRNGQKRGGAGGVGPKNGAKPRHQRRRTDGQPAGGPDF